MLHVYAPPQKSKLTGITVPVKTTHATSGGLDPQDPHGPTWTRTLIRLTGAHTRNVRALEQ